MKSLAFTLLGLPLVLLSFFLTGCSPVMTQGSYVSALTVNEAGVLAKSMTDFLTQHYPPAQTTFLLLPPDSSQANNPLTPALVASLKAKGFGIGNPSEHAPLALSLQYLVTPLSQEDVVLRMRIGQTEVSALYTRVGMGQFTQVSPFSLRRS